MRTNACYEYSRAFLSNILTVEAASEKQQIFQLRQSYICLHAVIAWAADADNLESTYKVAELGLLFCWDSVRTDRPASKKTKHLETLAHILDQFLRLYLDVSERYLKKTAFEHSNTLHALSVSVRSREAVDVNLAIFDLLGRVAIYGLWSDFFARAQEKRNPELATEFRKAAAESTDTIVALINNNPTLNSPLRDDHMIEVALCMCHAQQTQSIDRLISWIGTMADKTTFALITNARYPTSLRDYPDLLSHPLDSGQEYRDHACAGSVLYPYLYFWMEQSADPGEVGEFVQRLSEKIPNCTHQAWFPDEETDDRLWRGDTRHGICVPGLSPQLGNEAFIELLVQASKTCTAVDDMTAVQAGLLPLLLTACRHYRLPVPPNFWVMQDAVVLTNNES